MATFVVQPEREEQLKSLIESPDWTRYEVRYKRFDGGFNVVKPFRKKRTAHDEIHLIFIKEQIKVSSCVDITFKFKNIPPYVLIADEWRDLEGWSSEESPEPSVPVE